MDFASNIFTERLTAPFNSLRQLQLETQIKCMEGALTLRTDCLTFIFVSLFEWRTFVHRIKLQDVTLVQ